MKNLEMHTSHLTRRFLMLLYLASNSWLPAALAMASQVSGAGNGPIIAKATKTISMKTAGSPRVLTLVHLFIMRANAGYAECEALLDSVQEVSPDPIGKRECVNKIDPALKPAVLQQAVPGAYALSYRAFFPGFGNLFSVELYYPPKQRRQSAKFCPKYLDARKASGYRDVKCFPPTDVPLVLQGS